MTSQKRRLIGATAIAALALAGALVAWQAASDSPADPGQLTDAEKLEILNSGDAEAITELLEAEEAAAQAQFARERLERQQRLAEIEDERAEAKERGAAYWDSFDPESIDLTGFDFAMAEVTLVDERRATLDMLPIVIGFKRAEEMTHPPSKFDCNSSRYGPIDKFLKRETGLPMPVDASDVSRFLDYLADRAALETGDCSCATQAVPVEKGWGLLKRITHHPSAEAIRGNISKEREMNTVAILFRKALSDEARGFCEKG